MKILNKTATVTLNKLTEGFKEAELGHHIKIKNGSYMDLTLEKIDLVYDGFMIAISHSGLQNGDVMFDPEVIIVCKKDYFYAISFRNDYMNINQTSVFFEDGLPAQARHRQQKDHTVFLGQWLKNIKDQGFLELIK